MNLQMLVCGGILAVLKIQLQQTGPKINTTLEAWTREEQRVMIRFLGSEGGKLADVHNRMTRQYGDTYVSLQQMYECHRKF